MSNWNYDYDALDIWIEEWNSDIQKLGFPPGTLQAYCPACGKNNADLIRLDDSFSYAGTHCTGGKSGIAYGPNHNNIVTSCCNAFPELSGKNA